jgi:hypothetical protein
MIRKREIPDQIFLEPQPTALTAILVSTPVAKTLGTRPAMASAGFHQPDFLSDNTTRDLGRALKGDRI